MVSGSLGPGPKNFREPVFDLWDPVIYFRDAVISLGDPLAYFGDRMAFGGLARDAIKCM